MLLKYEVMKCTPETVRSKEGLACFRPELCIMSVFCYQFRKFILPVISV